MNARDYALGPGVAHLDPYVERLVEGRVVSVAGAIDLALAERVIAEVHWLQRADPRAPVTLEVMGPGGDVHAGLAIVDAARACPCPVRAVGTGLVASMSAVVLACAAPRGNRHLTANAEVMLHQVMGGMAGSQTDVELQAAHLHEVRGRIDRLLAGACGHDVAEVHAETDRDRWMTAEEAVAWGVADGVIGRSDAGEVAA